MEFQVAGLLVWVFAGQLSTATVLNSSQDIVLGQAMALVADKPENVDVKMFRQPVMALAQRSVAWTDVRARTVRVGDQSDAYKSAKKGKYAALVAALVHEFAHINGAGECGPDGAYSKQLETLRALGAKKSEIEVVLRGQDIVCR